MEERRKRRHKKFKSERDSRISKERRPFVPPEQTGVRTVCGCNCVWVSMHACVRGIGRAMG